MTGNNEQRPIPPEVYSAVFEAAPDGILVVASDGTIRYVNPQACKLFGYAESELLGAGVERLIPDVQRSRHEGHRARYGANPSRRPMNAGLELYGLHKDGVHIPVEISLSPATLDDGPVVIATVRDVTEATRLRAFSTGTLRASENERRRIAQELHDDTAQRLAAVKLGLKRIETVDVGEYHEICNALREEVGAIATDVSRIARGLRPPELDQIGVVESVRSWLSTRVGEDGPETVLDAEPIGRLLEPDQSLVLYRIIQEAVSNAVRHSEARHLRVVMRNREALVETIIQDDGVGFDVGRVSASAGGLGLMGMRERATMVGALVSIASRPGAGTTVRVVMQNRGS